MSTEWTNNDTCLQLQAKQVDLVQLHWWDYGVSGLKDVILTLGDLQSMGMVKSIGVTNFDTHHLEMLTDLDVPIVSNQVYTTLQTRVFDQAQKTTVIFLCCKTKIIWLTLMFLLPANRYLIHIDHDILNRVDRRENLIWCKGLIIWLADLNDPFVPNQILVVLVPHGTVLRRIFCNFLKRVGVLNLWGVGEEELIDWSVHIQRASQQLLAPKCKLAHEEVLCKSLSFRLVTYRALLQFFLCFTVWYSTKFLEEECIHASLNWQRNIMFYLRTLQCFAFVPAGSIFSDGQESVRTKWHDAAV